MVRFTAQEMRVLNMLSDGKRHTFEELKTCLYDELGSNMSLIVCISNIRKKLKPHDQYIHCIESRGNEPASYIYVCPIAVVGNAGNVVLANGSSKKPKAT